MTKKLYVGNLSFNTTQQALLDAFGQFGTVEAADIIMDRDSGRSKGFGFVTMADEDGFKKALEMNGKELDGRVLTVNEARPREERPAGGGNFNRNGGGRGNW